MALPKDGTNSKPAPKAKTGGSNRPSPTPTPGLAPTPSSAPKTKPAPVIGPVAPGSPAAKADPSRVANPVAPRKAPTKAAPKPAAAPAAANINGVPHDVYMAIVRAADENGVPRDLALAMAQQESGFNTHSVGDNGSSFGLYQLHKGGELTSAGLTPEQAYDAYTNASVALKVVGSVIRQHPDWSPGQIAAAAQRPADPVGYAKSVNGILSSGTFKAVPASASGSATAAAGAATPSDTGGTSADATSAPLPQTPQQVDDAVAAQYGYLAAFLHDPELGPILRQAAKEGWDSDRLQGAVYKTKWYQNHSNTTRQFDAQTRLDPATQKQQIMAQADDIVAQAKKSGLSLDQKSVAQLAWTSLRYGWTGQQLANAITAQGKMDLSGKTPNAALSTVDGLREQAKQYMVPVSDKQLSTWARQIISGQFTAQDFTSYVKEQAKSLFPTLAASIDRGVTVEQYADPYRNMAAQTLEIDPNAVDFMNDPKYSKAMYSIDPKTKERTPMSLSDWGTYLRGLPDYAKTAQANQQAAGMATSILNTFGQVAS